MKVFNVRLGHANNSSSTHSIIFSPCKNIYDDLVDGDSEFGWSFFTAASKEAKSDYLSLLLKYALSSSCSPEAIDAISRQWLGHKVPGDGYIDHQSVLSLPSDWEGRFVDFQFFHEFKDYLLTDGIVILGGNDNDINPHPLYSKELDTKLKLPRDERPNPSFVARKDPTYGYWTTFNRKTGAKVRLSFNPYSLVPEKAYAPELVDIKITDYCPFNCAYCYMGSTKEGKHAEEYHISRICYALSEMRVFEVALGGGEPTLHPRFPTILSTFKSYGIVPNFTTKSFHWMKDEGVRNDILYNCGSFAFSIESAADDNLSALLSNIKEYNIEPSRVSIQVVLGVISDFDFAAILDACHKVGIRITVLGYKNTGRGQDYINNNSSTHPDKILECIRKAVDSGKYPSIAVDTLAAELWEDKILKMGVPQWMFHTKEGKFSAYIDAVNNRMGPCSYCSEEEYNYLDGIEYPREYKLKEEILSNFSRY